MTHFQDSAELMQRSKRVEGQLKESEGKAGRKKEEVSEPVAQNRGRVSLLAGR